MFTNNQISIRAAGILKIFEYAAIALLLAAVACSILNIPASKILNFLGIALVAFAPTAGVITAGIVSLRKGKYRLFAYSLIILIVYSLGFIITR